MMRPELNEDFIDVLHELQSAGAEFVIVGAPLIAHGVTAEDISRAASVYQMGLPPRRIDILTSISGVDFEEAWASRMVVVLAGMELCVLGRDAMIRNKRAAGRAKGAIDADTLERGEREL